MFQIRVFVVLAGLLLVNTRAGAQQRTTVQLPTFNRTTVGTSVTVPDGGTAHLGGIHRAAEASTTRGVPILSKLPGANRLFQNRGIGRELGTMGMTVTPRVIDLQEEELRQTGISRDHPPRTTERVAPDQFGDGRWTDPAVAQRAAFLTRNIARHEALPAPQAAIRKDRTESLARLQQQAEQQAAARADEVERYYAEGWRAEAEGQLGVARIYYQMALRRAVGPQQAAIRARLAELDGSAPSRDRLAER